MLMAPCAGLGGLHGVVLVMDGRGRTGQIVDLIDLEIDWEGHIVPDEFKMFLFEQMFDVAARTGEKIVEANDVGAFRQQSFAQMRAEKSGTAGNQGCVAGDAFFRPNHSITLDAAGPCMAA
jgi:hypothetical protein